MLINKNYLFVEKFNFCVTSNYCDRNYVLLLHGIKLNMMICKVQSKMVERERGVFMIVRPQVSSGHVTYTFPEHASPGTNVTA